MCWNCDNPGKTQQDYLDEVVQPIIDEHGWMIQFVSGERRRPPFAYTVGLTAGGYPELLAYGLSQQGAWRLLQSAATHLVMHQQQPYFPGQRLTIHDLPQVEIVHIDHPEDHLYTAINLYGSVVRALQVVYSDDRGQWPWAVGFRGKQPILGVRSRDAA